MASDQLLPLFQARILFTSSLLVQNAVPCFSLGYFSNKIEQAFLKCSKEVDFLSTESWILVLALPPPVCP